MLPFNPICPFHFQKTMWPTIDGIPLYFYSKQREIIHSVETNDVTVVPAANKMGKDFVAGFIALSYFLRYPVVRIITTSVSDAHLIVLWSEIQRFIDNARFPLLWSKKNPTGCLYQLQKDIRKVVSPDGKKCATSYMLGKVSEKGEGLAGHHAPYTLAILDEACHDDKTEVLTDNGWMYFKDLTGEELLLSRDIETKFAEYRKPTHINKSHYNGLMYLYERRGASFCVTPNHKMLWKRYRAECTIKWSNPYLEEISKLNGTTRIIPRKFVWIGESPKYFELPGFCTPRKMFKSKSLPIEEWLEFLGWYMSEGSLAFNRHGEPSVINISQKSIDTLRDIALIAKKLGFNPKIYEGESSCLKIHETRLASYLYRFGRYCHEKRVPEFIGKLSPRLIEIFLKAYTDGDGYYKDGRDIIYTSSKKMADELQILSYKCGRVSSIQKRALFGLLAPNGISRHDGYVVSRSNKDNSEHIKIRREHLQKIQYDGMIYCACVPPNHTLFTRRSGVCMWSGNSGIDDIVFTQVETWAKRILIFGNPLPCVNMFHRFVKEGNVEAPTVNTL